MREKNLTGEQNILELQSVSLSFADKQILFDISFALENAKLYSIIGPNGAGKSTLLKCLNMLYRNWTGKIFLQGTNLRRLSQREIAGKVAFVSQQQPKMINYTVKDFLRLNRFAMQGAWSGLNSADNDALQFAIESTDIAEFLPRMLYTLSGGEAQKVFIAAALVQEPELLLLDEPTTYLDPRYQQEINLLLHNLKEKITILQVSHDVNSAAKYSDYLFLLKKGSLINQGEPAKMLNCEIMNELFDSNFHFLKHPKGFSVMV
jgi:iron complex transport system ATP-binding protein